MATFVVFLLCRISIAISWDPCLEHNRGCVRDACGVSKRRLWRRLVIFKCNSFSQNVIKRRFHCWFSNYVRRNQFYFQLYGPRCSSRAELQLVRAELQPLRVSCSSSRRVAAPIAELHTYARVARCNRRVARAPLSCNLNPELQPHLGQLQEVRFLLCGPLQSRFFF